MALSKIRKIYILTLSLIAGLITLSGCSHNGSEKVATSSDDYRKAVSAFYLGLAAVQTNHLNYAANQMLKVTKLYPDEPASWANLGVMALRRGNLDLAQKRLNKAKKRAPQNANIEFLIGLMENRRGKMDQALNHLKKAQQMDPDNMKILYTQVNLLERQNSRANVDQIEDLLKQILNKYPQNRVALIELARIAAKNGDHDILHGAVKKLNQQVDKDSKDLQNQLNNIEKAVETGNTRDIIVALAFLKNKLQKRAPFQQDKAAIQIPPSRIGFLITHFLKLPQPTAQIAPADSALSFETTPVPQAQKGSFVKPISLRGGLTPDILQINHGQVIISGHQRLDFPNGNSGEPSFRNIETIDYNYDFRNDLAFAGRGGFRLYRQNADTTFTNVTSDIGLTNSVINGSYESVWRADVDLDGDLDIILAPLQGAPLVLRNNGDSTFKTLSLFKDVRKLVDFAWADLDQDGDMDGFFLSKEGKLVVYLNERMAHFHRLKTSTLPVHVKSITISDLNQDGVLDLVAATAKNGIQRFWYDDQTRDWNVSKVVQSGYHKHERLFVSDLDNNGGMDILLSSPSGTQVWLDKRDNQYQKLKKDIPVFISSVSDLSGDQRLDLIGRSTTQDEPVKLINHGSKNYHAIVIRPRAAGKLKERRINAFGLGSEIEVRSGLMYQKILVTSPLVHIGLGTYKKPGMVRIVWPNGLVQANFSDLGNGSIITNHRLLKGSCPWLFTYNGNEVKFVTNITWSGGLGIRLNAQQAHGVVTTADRVKIRGEQLKPRHGYYDLRITGELWEVYYFDKIGLMAVDHPDSVHIFVNGRFSVPPPSLKVYVTDQPHPIAKAVDSDGNDVTSLVSQRDGKYADHFGHTKFMGLAKKHHITIDLGENFPGPGKGTRWLLAYGWMKPTNSSINLAISQGSVKRPQPISVQVPDGHGGWVTAKKNVGFPAGKNKMVMINLDGIFKHPGDHRIRLVTTTETYWDRIRWARELPDSLIKTKILSPPKEKLHYRGYSKIAKADSSSPGIPHYNKLMGTTQKWRAQIGFYTRYGDVSPLLKKVDNRYVIMGYGDEMLFRFKASPHLPKGWSRDFVLIANGWEKDDDYNTLHSKTVLPLPSHKYDGYKVYKKNTSLSLKNDPVYQAHKMDWVKYHTRYVTPKIFNHVLLWNGNR